jgi:hypothetical protein
MRISHRVSSVSIRRYAELAAGVLLFAATISVLAQSPPRVNVVADLLEAFDPNQAHDTLECAVRRPASAGGVKENGLFEHPLNTEKPARVNYRIDLPATKNGELLLLAFEIALSDGIKLGSGEDGVRFAIEVSGRTAFEQVVHEARWSSHAIDLTALAGQRVPIALLVDGLRNTSYDWALWGNPRVLRFQKGSIPANRVLPVAAGSLAVNCAWDRPLKIHLKPIGGGEALTWETAASPPGHGTSSWLVRDFSFASAKAVELSWEPNNAVNATSVRWGAFPPQLSLIRVSASRAVPVAGERVPLWVEVKNEGRGQFSAGDGRMEVRVAGEPLPQLALPVLAPGETWRGVWSWSAPRRTGHWQATARLETSDDNPAVAQETVFETFPAPRDDRAQVLENKQIRIEFLRAATGYAYARLFGRQDDHWTEVGVWRPFFRIFEQIGRGERDWEIRPPRFHRTSRLAGELSAHVNDVDTVPWTVSLRIVLEPDRPVAHLHYEWQAAQPRDVKALWGPNLYVGEGTAGATKTWGLFPGLEYLYGANRRRTRATFRHHWPIVARRMRPRSRYH